jgi:hypothetical protein
MRKALLYALFAIILFLGLALGVSAISNHVHHSAAQKTSDLFVSEVLAGDANASYKQFTNASQQAITQVNWQAEVNNLNNFFKGSSPHLQNMKDSGNFELATYALDGSDGKYTFTVVLSKSSSAWQIVSFTSRLQQ